jgi:hypothetical protein
MALTRETGQGITWSASASTTLSSSTRVDSDTFTFDATDIAAAVTITADNAGTPASGDIVDIYIKWSTGDVLGDTGDDFDTSEHAEYLGRLDTVAANTPGEDPARRTFSLNHMIGAKAFKLSVEAPQAASRNVVVRAMVATQRAA